MNMAAADIPKPAYAHNMRAIGHSDQGGRPDAVQVMVKAVNSLALELVRMKGWTEAQMREADGDLRAASKKIVVPAGSPLIVRH